MCASPLCGTRFEQTGIMRMKPRRYCSAQCRQDTWVLKQAGKLLANLPDDAALKIIRRHRVASAVATKAT